MTHSHTTTKAPDLPDGWTRKLTSEEINRLPLGSFNGPVTVVRSTDDAARAVKELSKETLLGFDAEARPSFTKGESHPVSILQLAAPAHVFLFQLRFTGLPDALTALLGSESVIKAGVAVVRDVAELRALSPFEPKGFVDLGDAAKRAGLQHHGLRGLASLLLGFRISKSAGRTNWARSDLTPEQVRYAATDAWLGWVLYLRMREAGLGLTPHVFHPRKT